MMPMLPKHMPMGNPPAPMMRPQIPMRMPMSQPTGGQDPSVALPKRPPMGPGRGAQRHAILKHLGGMK
jgi:hypothetical protein